MSELLDAFDDEGLTDPDTRHFLVEALANAEPADWRDVIEPFLPPERALQVLASVPGVLQRSLAALAPGEERGPAVSPIAQAFLLALPGGVLAACGLHTAARCARICRTARELLAPTSGAGALFWQRRAEASAARWHLLLPRGGSWRERYLALLRPRCDGVYVGECRFKRYLRLGHHTDLRKNAAALAAKGDKGHISEWLHYRRYVRVLPEGHNGCLRALVLQDACPRHFAERVLNDGVDLDKHENPTKPETVLTEGSSEGITDPGRLRKRICLGSCVFSHEEQLVEILYSAGDGEFHLAFHLRHGGPGAFSSCLEWAMYTRTDKSGEVLAFNLGRLPDYRGGGLADEDKDHYPALLLRPKISLEHLL